MVEVRQERVRIARASVDAEMLQGQFWLLESLQSLEGQSGLFMGGLWHPASLGGEPAPNTTGT